jgi:hypothetical protein
MQTTTLAPMIDAAKLQRRTMGDVSLQVEVLSLFVAEAERLMRQIEDAPTAELRTDRIQAMISVARNVGAERVTQAARVCEKQISPDEQSLEPLRTALAETLAYVRQTG